MKSITHKNLTVTALFLLSIVISTHTPDATAAGKPREIDKLVIPGGVAASDLPERGRRSRKVGRRP